MLVKVQQNKEAEMRMKNQMLQMQKDMATQAKKHSDKERAAYEANTLDLTRSFETKIAVLEKTIEDFKGERANFMKVIKQQKA